MDDMVDAVVVAVIAAFLGDMFCYFCCYLSLIVVGGIATAEQSCTMLTFTVYAVVAVVVAYYPRPVLFIVTHRRGVMCVSV